VIGDQDRGQTLRVCPLESVPDQSDVVETDELDPAQRGPDKKRRVRKASGQLHDVGIGVRIDVRVDRRDQRKQKLPTTACSHGWVDVRLNRSETLSVVLPAKTDQYRTMPT